MPRRDMEPMRSYDLLIDRFWAVKRKFSAQVDLHAHSPEKWHLAIGKVSRFWIYDLLESSTPNRVFTDRPSIDGSENRTVLSNGAAKRLSLKKLNLWSVLLPGKISPAPRHLTTLTIRFVVWPPLMHDPHRLRNETQQNGGEKKTFCYTIASSAMSSPIHIETKS